MEIKEKKERMKNKDDKRILGRKKRRKNIKRKRIKDKRRSK